MRPISAKDLKDKLQSGQKLTLLDVRESSELAGELGHIDGIKHIPLAELPTRLGELGKDTTLVTICRVGARAGRASEFLEASGFAETLVLTDGMIGWNEAGLPVKR